MSNEIAVWFAERLLTIAHARGPLDEGTMQGVRFALMMQGLEVEAELLEALKSTAMTPPHAPKPAEADAREWPVVGTSLVAFVVDEVLIAPVAAAQERANALLQELGLEEQIEPMGELVIQVLMSLGDQARRHALFRNLYLLAAADDEISVEEEGLLSEVAAKLGVPKGAAEFVKNNADTLDFVTPDGKEERDTTLDFAIRMIAADGVIDEREVSLGRVLASRLGFSIADFEARLDEAAAVLAKEPATRAEVVAANRQICKTLFTAFAELENPAPKLIDAFRNPSGAVAHYQDAATNKVFYDFFWLLNVRTVDQDESTMMKLPTLLMKAASGFGMGDIESHILRTEAVHGTTLIEVGDWTIDEVQAAITAFWGSH